MKRISILIFFGVLQTLSYAVAVKSYSTKDEQQQNMHNSEQPAKNSQEPFTVDGLPVVMMSMETADISVSPSEFICNGNSANCANFGVCRSDGKCECPTGYGSPNCSKPLCGANGDRNRKPIADGQHVCDCAEGWEGFNCNVCSADDVCQKYLDPDRISDLKPICYKVSKVSTTTTSLTVDEMLRRLIGDTRLNVTFQCDKKDIDKPGLCFFESIFERLIVSTVVWIDEEENFGCQLSDCAFSAVERGSIRSYGGRCAKAECRCIPGTLLCGKKGGPDISDVMPEVKGPATFICTDPPHDKGRYNCEFDEPIFREQIGPILGENAVFELKCASGECMNDFEIPQFELGMSQETIILIVLSGLALVLTIIIGFCCITADCRKRLIRGPPLPEHVDSELEQLMQRTSEGPVSLSFQDISYEISRRGQNKRVLRGIYGHVKAGEVLAIMGPSGAGKSTCLDILASKPKKGIVSGKVLVNGKVPTRQQFKKISGFVDQEDTLLSTLTVFETVLYSALLRLPRSMSMEAKKKRVHETLTQLGIDKIANSRIGSPGHRGISGGEKRRVSIAMEVVTGASILFLDEPTSGLDSYNALSVVQSLVNLARNYNRTIILTIHQPRSNIFAMFDKLLLLAEGGYMVYSGPISKKISRSRVNTGESSSHTIESLAENEEEEVLVLNSFLDEMGAPCPIGFNIADFLIDLTVTGNSNETSSQASKETLVAVGISPLDSHDNPTSNDGNSKKDAAVKMKTLISPGGTRRSFVSRPSQYVMNPRDVTDLQCTQSHLVHLVTGYLKSDVCKEMKESMSSEFSPTINTQIPIRQNPSSASLPRTPQSPVAVSPEEMPLLNNQQSGPRHFGPGSVHEAPPSYDDLYTPTNRPFPAMWNTLFPSDGEKDKKASWVMQFQILSWRTLMNVVRNPFLLIAHYLIAIFIGVVCAIVFRHLPLTVAGFQNRFGLFFFLCMVNALINLTTVDIFSRERMLFVRERANGYYGVSAYFLSKVVCDILPLRLIPPLISGLILYYPVGFVPDSLHLMKFLIALVLTNLAAASLVFIFAAAFASASTANFVNVMVLVVGFLFGGLMANKRFMPWYVSWIRYYSPFNYGYEAMCVNEMPGLVLRDIQYGTHITATGGVVLSSFGLNVTSYWTDILALVEISIVYFLLSFLVLQVYVKETR